MSIFPSIYDKQLTDAFSNVPSFEPEKEITSQTEVNRKISKKIIDGKTPSQPEIANRISQVTLRDREDLSAEEQYDKLYVDKVSWYDVLNASTRLSVSDYTGVGFLNNFMAKHAVAFKKDMDKPLTSFDWQHSHYFRPGIQYYDGMTVIQAMHLADAYDDREYFKALIRKGGYKSAEIIGSISGVVLDPTLIVGAGPVTKLLQIEKLAQVGYFASKPIRARAVIGGLQNGAVAVATAPIARYNKKTYGDLYSWGEFVENSLGAVAIGAGIGAASGLWRNWFNNLKLEDRQDVLKHIRTIEITASEVSDDYRYFRQAYGDMHQSLDQMAEVGVGGLKAIEEELPSLMPKHVQEIVLKNLGEEKISSAEIIEGNLEADMVNDGGRDTALTDFGNPNEVNQDLIDIDVQQQFKNINKEDVGITMAEDNIVLPDEYMMRAQEIEKAGIMDDFRAEALKNSDVDNVLNNYLADETIPKERKDEVLKMKEEIDKIDEFAKDENFYQKILKCFV